MAVLAIFAQARHQAIRDAVEAGRIPATGKVKAIARVTLEGMDLDVAIDGNIDLG